MEDLFGSDADSDPERKGGVRRASVETGVVGLLRREPDSDPIPGLRALWRRWRMALPLRLPQRPLLPWRCQPFPEGGDEGTDAECVPRGFWCPSSKSSLGAWGAKGARGRNGGRWAGAARGGTLRVLLCPALHTGYCEWMEVTCSGTWVWAGRICRGALIVLLNETRTWRDGKFKMSGWEDWEGYWGRAAYRCFALEIMCLPRTCAKTPEFLESVVLDWGAYEVCVWREGVKDLVMKWISKCMFMMQGSTMWILVWGLYQDGCPEGSGQDRSGSIEPLY